MPPQTKIRWGVLSTAAIGLKKVIPAMQLGELTRVTAIASRDAWLARAIESVVSPRERAALGKSIELLERLADAAGHPES